MKKKRILIEPINIPKKGIGVYLNIKLGTYQLWGDKLKGTAEILDKNNHVISKEKFIIGKDIIDIWGTDDSIIAQFVSDFMVVTIKSIEDVIDSYEKKETIYERLYKLRKERFSAIPK